MQKAVIDLDKLVKHDRVHGQVYTDKDLFQQELEKIWYRVWVYVGHESEVPNNNDFIMKSIGPQQVIMSRDSKGEIHLLVNRCPHRGNQLCTDKKGNRGSFTCPYHGWTFNNNGKLRGQPFRSGYETANKDELGMAHVPRVASYKGFVFGSFAAEGPSLEEHLGRAKETLDRVCMTSPEDEIEITAGFLQHKAKSNWKFLVENETDGYHPAFVHSSIFMVADSGIGDLYKEGSTARARDLGDGHTEIDLRPEFRRIGKPLGWFGTSEERLPEYAQKMKEAYGEEKAREIMIDGTPHVMIFPNLFIAEIQLFSIQPLAHDLTVQNVTALQFKGAPDLNRRMRQQTMGSVGPAGFLLADDSEMYERTQRGAHFRAPEYNFLGRGIHRESDDEEGARVGDVTDEVTSRGIWKHYRALMEVS